ncbi:hypothetical protein, partial [Enterobacter cloacae]|uniref:hypothetical protein n=1 Tax=Enterobacter cloacae TaxID=550 RepID=UPI00207675F6
GSNSQPTPDHRTDSMNCYFDDVDLHYHNIRYQHRQKRAEGVSDGKPVKQATNHPKTRQKRAGSVFMACMSMHASA